MTGPICKHLRKRTQAGKKSGFLWSTTYTRSLVSSSPSALSPSWCAEDMPPDFCHHHHHVGIDGFIVYKNYCDGLVMMMMVVVAMMLVMVKMMVVVMIRMTLCLSFKDSFVRSSQLSPPNSLKQNELFKKYETILASISVILYFSKLFEFVVLIYTFISHQLAALVGAAWSTFFVNDTYIQA